MNLIRPDSALPRQTPLPWLPLPQQLRGWLRRGSVGIALAAALASSPAAAVDVLPLPLAQANPAPIPSNVRKVGRLYVVESVVVLVLFGGAIYAVCRSSRRT